LVAQHPHACKTGDKIFRLFALAAGCGAGSVAGAAFTWTHVGLVAGAGYGHYFIPGINLALAQTSITPEGSLWVYF